MKRFISFITAMLTFCGIFSFGMTASANTIELSDIFTEYTRGDTIVVQGTTDAEVVAIYVLDPGANMICVVSADPNTLMEGEEISIGNEWELGSYTMRISYGPSQITEFHFEVVKDSTSSSGNGNKTPVKATGISISPARLELKLGESGQVKVTSEESSVRWETDDTSLISIEGTADAIITAKKVGTATAWAYSGNNYVTLTVVITPAEKHDTVSKPDETDKTENQNNNVVDKQDAFTDLSDVAWAKDAINTLADDGIVNGIGDGTFAPQRNVTRAEFVKMIVEAFDFEDKGEVAFGDVSDSDWFAEYVLIAANNGIVNGYDGKFFPTDNISCQDAALILKRVADMKNITLPSGYEEISGTAEYAAKAVAELNGGGIIGEAMEFRPTQEATRAQSAYLIAQVYELRG